ncbi:MAG: exodeoxyribonuclease VII small subunit [Elusimicrobia bacterium RIFCSPHIGHO2_02_FULL_57_9]|nr:MAG: exodeoxyribonuclease VII small subunit [Elusimicrobia bacterium RIFCSPHIGHO2_02_FULL_57_9]
MKNNNKKETFENSLDTLENLVRQLESGDKGLEESLALFEKGITLAKTLTKQLEEAKTKVEVLTKENGKPSRKPFCENQ